MQAEQTAREAGCVAMRLDAFEFPARPFYERRRLRATMPWWTRSQANWGVVEHTSVISEGTR